MKIAIIGYGFVGKALKNALLLEESDILIIDPLVTENRIIDLNNFSPNIVFICVPTPMLDDGGQDLSILEEVISDINETNIDSLIVLKSTVLPDSIDKFSISNKKFIYNPEFLRELSANDDFINSEIIIFGGRLNYSKKLAKFYDVYTKCVTKEYQFTDPMTASFVKYTINSFLALKLTFFNQIYNLLEASNGNNSWENFTRILKLDKRLGNSHMKVPGDDGRKGFGGACLPKDVNAFYEYSLKTNDHLSLLKKVININNKIRSQYIIETEREKDQNIKFFEEEN